MSEIINGIKSDLYRKEIIDTLQKLVKGMPAYNLFPIWARLYSIDKIRHIESPPLE